MSKILGKNQTRLFNEMNLAYTDNKSVKRQQLCLIQNIKN